MKRFALMVILVLALVWGFICESVSRGGRMTPFEEAMLWEVRRATGCSRAKAEEAMFACNNSVERAISYIRRKSR